jgi:FAD/FMN-containing dehydrogenase
MANCNSNHTFENWARTIKFRPGRYCQPTTEAQVVAVVKDAALRGGCVRTAGAGHSFSQLLATTDTLVNLDNLAGDITVNGTRATVPGGMRLKDLIPALRERGLGFRNIGSVTEQSIAGAFSTGTHGTGLRIGSISTQVVGVKMVTATGDVRTIDETEMDLLKAVRLNLGALGIITEVTLECVPDYQLEYTAYLTTFDHIIDKIDTLTAENERVLFWWLLPPFGPRNKVVVITKNPIGHPKGILGNATPSLLDLAGGLFARAFPRDVMGLPTVALDVLTNQSDGFRKIVSFTADYDDVLTIPLLPVFHRECEYAIPVENTAEALKGFRTIVDEGDMSLILPVEVRFLAKDDIPISPSLGRDVCYIGASTLHNATEVFERFEPLMTHLGGRPHWGKNFTLTRDDFDAMYPGTLEAFRVIRRDLDPDGVFLNSFLRDYFS